MRSSFVARTGLKLARTPNHREQVARRRAAVAAGMLALALISGVIGALGGARHEAANRTHTGPFSYFPSE